MPSATIPLSRRRRSRAGYGGGRTYLNSMMQSKKRGGIAIAAAALLILAAQIPSALAQNQNPVFVPGQPAPVPVPPPPVTNSQPPGAPPKLDTFSDKVSRCMHYGGTIGLPPGQRDTYVRACANN